MNDEFKFAYLLYLVKELYKSKMWIGFVYSSKAGHLNDWFREFDEQYNTIDWSVK